MNRVLQRWLKAFIWASILIYFSSSANSQTNPDITNSSSTITQWQMVWLSDIGLSKLKLPHDGLATHRQDFIRTVYIQTEMFDGELLTTRASANCNSPFRVNRKVVVKPATMIPTHQNRNGTFVYKEVPATYKTVVDYGTTQVGCTVGYEVDGKTYEMTWPNAIENFMLVQMQKAIHYRQGNTLEWLDDENKIIARFEKHQEINVQ